MAQNFRRRTGGGGLNSQVGSMSGLSVDGRARNKRYLVLIVPVCSISTFPLKFVTIAQCKFLL